MELTRRKFFGIVYLVNFIASGQLATAATWANKEKRKAAGTKIPSISLEDAVGKGYQSLASKAIGIIDELTQSKVPLSTSITDPLEAIRPYLTMLRESGDPTKLEREAEEKFQTTIGVLGDDSRNGFYRSGPDGLALTLYLVTKHFKIDGLRELLKRAGLKGTRFSSKNSGVVYSKEEDGREVGFYAYYHNPKNPAHSVVVNTRELYRLLQNEIYEARAAIQSGLEKIKGYKKFRARIDGDSELSRQEAEVLKRANLIAFLERDDVQDIAAQEGVDMNNFRKYLVHHKSRLNVWDMLLEGLANNASYRLLMQVEASSQGILNEKEKQQYTLIALLDAFSVAIRHHDSQKHIRGIGLGSYLWDKPKSIAGIIQEPEKIGKHIQ